MNWHPVKESPPKADTYIVLLDWTERPLVMRWNPLMGWHAGCTKEPRVARWAAIELPGDSRDA